MLLCPPVYLARPPHPTLLTIGLFFHPLVRKHTHSCMYAHTHTRMCTKENKREILVPS